MMFTISALPLYIFQQLCHKCQNVTEIQLNISMDVCVIYLHRASSSNYNEHPSKINNSKVLVQSCPLNTSDEYKEH